MNVASVDSNVLLRALLHNGSEHSRRAQALLADPDTIYRVSETAIIEVVFVLGHHYGFSRKQIAIVVTALADRQSLVWDREVGLAAIEHFLVHPKLSFEDCLMAEQAKSSGATPLYTFDRKLAEQHPAVRLVR